MLRVVIILAVVLFALLRGGRLTNLATIRVRRMSLVLASFTIRILIDTPFLAAPLVRFWTTPLFLLSFGLLIWWIWENRQLAGGLLIGAGIVMNLAAIAANGGAMPVDPVAALYAGKPLPDAPTTGALADVHRTFSDGTALWMLTDIFPIPAGIPFAAVYSIGDIILTIGIAILCYRTMLIPAPPTPEAAPVNVVAASAGER
jgi:hypothetical protein